MWGTTGAYLHSASLAWAAGALCLSSTLMALKGPCVFQADEDLQQNFIKTKLQVSP